MRVTPDIWRRAQQHGLSGSRSILPIWGSHRRMRRWPVATCTNRPTGTCAGRVNIDCNRSISSKLSITINATFAVTAASSSAIDLALPCTRMRSGEKPAFSARCNSPPEATSHHRPSCASNDMTAVHGNALEANTTWKSRRPASAPAWTNARARARRSSSATTYAGVPNSRASSTVSHPPTST